MPLATVRTTATIMMYQATLCGPARHPDPRRRGSRMKANTATTWITVLAFPQELADITWFLAAAIILRPDTANSRAMITIAIQADSLSRLTNEISAAAIRSLSAKGSRNAPMTVTERCRRAR